MSIQAEKEALYIPIRGHLKEAGFIPASFSMKKTPKGAKIDSANRARTCDIMINSHALYRLSYGGIEYSPYGIRTRVTAVKRRCLNLLTNGPEVLGFPLNTLIIIPDIFSLSIVFFNFFTFFEVFLH